MSSNSQSSSTENFLDKWLIEQGYPTNIPFQMKLETYFGHLQLEKNRLKHLASKKARGAPKKVITKPMLRADKPFGKRISYWKRHQNPSHKVVIEFLIQAANILYDNNAISKEDRDLFTLPSMKSIQNTISKGLKELEDSQINQLIYLRMTLLIM